MKKWLPDVCSVLQTDYVRLTEEVGFALLVKDDARYSGKPDNMLSAKQKRSIRLMVQQACVASEFQFMCSDTDRIEATMRKSVLKRNPEVLEYAVAYMRKFMA